MIGGAEIYRLEYFYLVFPILINVICIMALAIVFNAFFPWRRYPAHLTRRTLIKPTVASERQF